MKFKIIDTILLLAFIVVVASAVGIEIGGSAKHFFKEIHEFSGWVFIAAAVLHIWLHRSFIKAMFKRSKP